MKRIFAAQPIDYNNSPRMQVQKTMWSDLKHETQD